MVLYKERTQNLLATSVKYNNQTHANTKNIYDYFLTQSFQNSFQSCERNLICNLFNQISKSTVNNVEKNKMNESIFESCGDGAVQMNEYRCG